MKTRHLTRSVLILALFLAMLASTSQAQEPLTDPAAPEGAPDAPQAAVGSALTYQGLLNKNGSPASASCDFQFSLWNAAAGGSQVGSTLTKTSVAVTKGVFTTSLNFGEAAFLTGEARWLQIAVRCPAGGGGYTTLTSRQTLTTTPYALHSRGVWNFGATGSLQAGTPLGNGPGWMIYAANGHRRDIVGSNPGVYIGASPNSGPANPNLVVSENGNVGVGLDLPAEKLHVVGNRIRLQNGGKVLDLRADGSAVDLESNTSSVFISSIGAGHHVVINPDAGDGNVGIGTAGPTAGKLQIYSTGADGIRVVKGNDDGIQIGDGTNFPSYGLWMPDPGVPYNAVSVRTANPAGEWGVYTPDKISAANVTLSSVTMVAVVGGDSELAAGDVVAAVGFVPSVVGESKPLARVTLAVSGSSGIAGVVESRMELVPEPGKADINPPPLALYSVPGPAQAGDYVAITIAGVAQVKVDAGAAPITAGQRLTGAKTPGQARALRSANLDGMVVTEGAPVIGVALEPLAAGQGLIWVLVNPQ